MLRLFFSFFNFFKDLLYLFILERVTAWEWGWGGVEGEDLKHRDPAGDSISQP